MATNSKQKPFNLLYRFEPQKSNIDIVYDFVVVQGRYIVVTVMFIVILAFIYRFPLDKQLNDEINKANKNLRDISLNLSDNTVKTFNDNFSRTEKAKEFVSFYPTDFNAKTKPTGEPKFSVVFEKVNKLREDFGDTLTINSYSYDIDSNSKITLKLSGEAQQFSKAEEYREKIRKEDSLFQDVLISNLTAVKDQGAPKFEMNITLKAGVPLPQ